MTLDGVKKAMEMAQSAFREHDNVGSRKKYEEALSLIQQETVSDSSRRLRADALKGLIEVLDNAGEWLAALEYAGVLINEAVAMGDKRTEVDARLLACQVHLHRGNWEEAKGRYQKVLELAEKANNRHGVAEAYYGLGYTDWRRGDVNSAKFKTRKAMDLLAGDAESMLSCKTTILMGTIEDAAGNTTESIGLFKKAIDALDNFHPGEELARACNNLGEVYKGIEDYESAAEQYKKCVEVSELVDSKRGYLYGLSNLAECYAFTGRMDDARDALKKVEVLLKKAQEKYIAAQVPHAYGLLHYFEKNYPAACSKFKEAIEGLKKIGNPPYDLGIFWYRYGLALKASGDRDAAEEAFDNAERQFSSIKAKVYLKKLRESR